MKYTNTHTHNTRPQKNETSVINIFAQETKNFNFNKKYFYSIGLHPWHADIKINFDIIEKKISDNKNIIAIGEIGLDKYKKIPLNLQIDIFIKQIKIAKKYNLPVIIHCVRAIQEIIEIKKDISPNNTWIFHNFNKNTTTAERLLKNNFILSFGDILLKNNTKIIESIKNINVNNILLENDNSNIPIYDIYKQISLIKNINIHKLKSIINKNFNRTFNL